MQSRNLPSMLSETPSGLLVEFGRMQANQVHIISRVERLETRVDGLEVSASQKASRPPPPWQVAVDWKMAAVFALLVLGLAGLYTVEDVKTIIGLAKTK